MTCPQCGHDSVHAHPEKQKFEYGDEPHAVLLTADVLVSRCDECGFEFTDDSAEEARHDAVCEHLGVMTPRQIKDLRGHYKLSRSEFAQISKIGEASLARWESGALTQSPAYALYLYLLSYPENFERLRTRVTPGEPKSAAGASTRHVLASAQHTRPRLRCLQLTEEDYQASRNVFSLRPTGT